MPTFEKWKSARRRRKHSTLAVVRQSQKFSPHSRPPFPGAWEGQSARRWSLPLPTNPVWWGSMHASSSYRGNRPTNKYSHKPTNSQDWLQYTAPQLAYPAVKVQKVPRTRHWRHPGETKEEMVLSAADYGGLGECCEQPSGSRWNMAAKCILMPSALVHPKIEIKGIGNDKQKQSHKSGIYTCTIGVAV